MTRLRKLGPSPLLVALAAAHLVLSTPATEGATAAPAVPTAFKPSWGRQIDFAQGLGTHRYFDLAEHVLAGLVANPDILVIERATLYRLMGDFYLEQSNNVAAGTNGLSRFLEYLSKARGYHLEYLEHPSIQGVYRHSAEAFRVRTRASWVLLLEAEGHARFLEDPDVPKEAKEKHKADARALFGSALDELKKAIDGKQLEVERLRAAPNVPGQPGLYKAAREEAFTVRFLRGEAHLPFARFLENTQAPDKERMDLLQAAEKDLRQLLIDYHGGPLDQVNLAVAANLIEQGPARDADALDRLDDLLRTAEFARHKRIPCEAAHLKAILLRRQKKPQDAIAVLDDLLKYRSNGAWDPRSKATEPVRQFLADTRTADREDYDQKALAGSFLLMAECYGALGDEAKAAKDPAKARRLYGTAFDLGEGVLEAKARIDLRYADLIERWRIEAGRPESLSILWTKYRGALAQRAWLRAAYFLTEFIRRSHPGPGDAPRLYSALGQLYFQAARYYEAYTTYWAVARWFPARDASRAQQLALTCLAEQAKQAREKSPEEAKFAESVLARARLEVESEDPGYHTLSQAKALRGNGDLAKALDLLKAFRPDSAHYAAALGEAALGYRGLFERTPEADRRKPAAQEALRKALDCFQAALDHSRSKILKLAGEEHAAARTRLLNDVAVILAYNCQTCLPPYLSQPAKVVELTSDLEKSYPGIDAAAAYPALHYCRLCAARNLAESDPAHADQHLAVLDEAWKALLATKEAPRIALAAFQGSQAYLGLAARLKADLDKAPPAARPKLAERIAACQDRALEFSLQLIAANPQQPLATYSDILRRLKTREPEPRSADYRRIAEIAPNAIKMFKDDPRAAERLLSVKAYLGIAQAQLGDYAKAIPVLEEVHTVLRARHQEAAKGADQKKARDLEATAPRRDWRHPEVMECLARSYLAANARDKYPAAIALYNELVPIHLSSADPKDQGKYWDDLYGLCEAQRRVGNHVEAVRLVARADLQTDHAFYSRENRARFRSLVEQLRKDVETVADATQRRDLIRQLDEIRAGISESAPRR